MERLLAHINPHHPPPDRALLDAQRACGRWCALRRLHRGLTSEQFAGMVDISVEQLRWLESGVAQAGEVPDSARQRLSRFLRSQDDDRAWVAAVVALACGRAEALSAAVVGTVLDELEAVDTPTERERELALELVGSLPAEQRPVAVDLSQYKQAPIMFEVLRALNDGNSYPYAIWEQVHQQIRSVSIPELVELLDQMCANNLIEQTGTQSDPTLDDEPLPVYQIATPGHQAYNAERTRRAQLATSNQLLPQTDPTGEMGLNPH
jgi:hypothetical protein